ncbi:MAG: glycosyltransferase [Myxococcota bacterium]|nr:glycosyltransferase [Myxococcota bacterium]
MRPLIIHMVTRLDNGGAQRQTLQIVSELPRGEFEVALIYGEGGFLDDHAEAVEDLMLLPLTGLQRSMGLAADWQALRQVVACLKPLCKGRHVILHTHSSKAGVLGRLAAKWAGAKAVHTVHGFGFHAGGSELARSVLLNVERSMRRLSDWVLTVAQADRQFGIDKGLMLAEKSSVIRSGIDVRAFARQPELGRALRGELGIPAEAPVIGTVACLKAQKAPLDHIEAFAEFLTHEPEAHFIWVGDGELMDALRQRLAQDKTLQARVHLLGWSDRIVALLSALDLFLLISLWEGLPRSLLEARAAGLPCVVSDTCGNPEAIGYGDCGVVVPMNAPTQAAQALLKLWRNPQRRAQLRERCAAGLEVFDAEHVTPMHIDLYRRLLTKSDID